MFLSETNQLNCMISLEDTSTALREYCAGYITSLDDLRTECMARRDAQISQLNIVKQQMEEHQHYIAELYPKQDTCDPKEEYKHNVNTKELKPTDLERSDEEETPRSSHMKLEGGTERGLRICTTQDVSPKAELSGQSLHSENINSCSIPSQRSTKTMPTVNDKARKRGKTAMAALPKHGLFLKERPEWNSQ